MIKNLNCHLKYFLSRLRVLQIHDRKYHKAAAVGLERLSVEGYEIFGDDNIDLPTFSTESSEAVTKYTESKCSSSLNRRPPAHLCAKNDLVPSPLKNVSIDTTAKIGSVLKFFYKNDTANCFKFLSNVSPTGFVQGLNKFVYQFIQSEIQSLSQSFEIKHGSVPKDISVFHLDDNVYWELAKQVDDYSRFVTLLSYHPLAIPYRILLQCYTQLPRVAQMEKNTLIKTLVFHNAWNELWELILSHDTSLTCIEEAIDEIIASLISNKNLELGFWLALTAAKKVAVSKNLYSLISEFFAYKISVPNEKMALFNRIIRMKYANIDEGFLSPLKKKERNVLEKYPDLKAFALLKYSESLLDVHYKSKKIIGVCRGDPRLNQISGFVSEAVRVFGSSQLVHFFVTRRSTLRNELDFYHLIKEAHADEYYQMYLSICYSYRQQHIPNDYVINMFVMKSHLVSHDVFWKAIRKFYRLITVENLNQLLALLLKHEDGREILRTMNRRQHEKYSALVQKVISSQQDTRLLLLLLELTSRKGRVTIRRTLKYIGSGNNYMEAILGNKFSEYNWTEVWRYGVRENLLNHTNTGCIFQKAISKCWNVNALNHRYLNLYDGFGMSDFREKFSCATIAERRRLEVRLQAMAQALSQADAPQIASTINILSSYLYESEKFLLFKDISGKNYIFHHFVKYIMKFIHRSNITGAGVRKMKAVLKILEFDSTETQTSIYECMTFDCPEIAFQILKKCKMKPAKLSKPMIEAIERGILTSRYLEKQDRLRLFQKFQEEKARLGLGKHIYVQSMTLMGNLIFDIADTINDATRLKTFIDTAYKIGVPARIIKKWSSKV